MSYNYDRRTAAAYGQPDLDTPVKGKATLVIDGGYLFDNVNYVLRAGDVPAKIVEQYITKTVGKHTLKFLQGKNPRSTKTLDVTSGKYKVSLDKGEDGNIEIELAVTKPKTAMEHSSPEALKKYLHDHPGADPKNHHVEKKDDKEEEDDDGYAEEARKWKEEDEAKEKKYQAQRSSAGVVGHLLRDTTLSKGSMKAVEKLRRDLDKGTASKEDVSDAIEYVDFDVQNETGGKRNLKKVQNMLEALKKIHKGM